MTDCEVVENGLFVENDLNSYGSSRNTWIGMS